jgi:hypothetical protein
VQKTMWELARLFGAFIPHRGDKRKQEVMVARDAKVTPYSPNVRLGSLSPPQPPRNLGVLYVFHHTRR